MYDIVCCLRAARPIPVTSPSAQKRGAKIISRAETRINATRAQVRRVAARPIGRSFWSGPTWVSMSVTGRNTSRVSDRFGDKVERLEEAQECGHGWSPGVPGWNPWVSVKKLDPPRQGRRKLGIAAFFRPFRAGTMKTPVIHGFRPHGADFTRGYIPVPLRGS